MEKENLISNKTFKFIDRIPFVRTLDHHMHEVISGTTVVLAMKLLGVGLAFFFNVLLARMLGADGTGIYYLAVTVVTVSTIFGRMGLDNTLLRLTATSATKSDWSTLTGAYKKGMSVAMVASLIAALFLWILSPWIASGLFSKPDLSKPLQWMTLSVVPMTFVYLHAEMLKGLKRIFIFSLVQGQNGIVLSAISIISLSFLGRSLGLMGAAWAFILAAFGTASTSVWLWRRNTPQLKNTTGQFGTAKLLRSSMPLFLVASMNLILNWTSTVLLGVWGTSADVGIFSMASRTAALISFILMAMNSILAPKFAALYIRGDIETLGRTARNASALVTLIVSPIFLLFVLFPDLIMGLFGKKFIGGSELLVILSAGQFVNVITGSVACLLVMTGHERLQRNIMVISLVLNVLLNAVLIPQLGTTGASIAVAVTLSVQNLIAAGMVKHKLGIVTIPLLWGKKG